ncbi:helix-turn-helix transcriptional regulator [Pseudoalteromonas sp. MIP2626]|nr:helix-turn-helix transcriptional regulator [Pseudoalteromonas sp. MIP2626]
MLYHKLFKKIRLSKKITQLQLAELLGRPQSFVSKYESGERKIELSEFFLICNALDEAPTELIKEIQKGIQYGYTKKF